LNGVFLEGEPQSVDDVGRDEHGGKIELFHVGPQDAHKFDISNGLVANQESELAKPPKRPHRFQ
jgi:allophanate hydrolase subunit 2